MPATDIDRVATDILHAAVCPRPRHAIPGSRTAHGDVSLCKVRCRPVVQSFLVFACWAMPGPHTAYLYVRGPCDGNSRASDGEKYTRSPLNWPILVPDDEEPAR
eukprot:3356532-Rhodomonas_salina.2